MRRKKASGLPTTPVRQFELYSVLKKTKKASILDDLLSVLVEVCCTFTLPFSAFQFSLQTKLY